MERVKVCARGGDTMADMGGEAREVEGTGDGCWAFCIPVSSSS